MKTKKLDLEAYYSLDWCAKCKAKMTKEEKKVCKKAGFLRLCKVCYTPMREALKKCQPLMQRFSQR
jgi:hypothetical protein